ncbi:MAG: Coenzyme F420 hydrogenase/dehydrogenase, beta subunit C-terminal domain [Erysipelotrichaceae bacterium]|jgi:coenzyme F420-reducing hydrogenase beta subunit
MLFFTKNKYDCSGCGACKAVCPVDCISFSYDEEGFLYPTASDKCINCGMCESVCPLNDEKICDKDITEQYSIAGRHKDDDVWQKSASGGAFTAICETYQPDVIFGAKFEELKVVHDYITDIKEIDVFRKSKYVQSDMKNTHRQLKKMLEENKKVLFSGTPCQVAGVKKYLKKEYDNLLCVDLVCHGVGSPGVFEKYIEYLEKKYNSKVKTFTFRHKKKKFGRMDDYIVLLEFADGRKIEHENDLYNSAFLQALLLRPSCEKCKFSNRNRQGDLTISDFKRKYELLPEIKDIENFSTVLINTEKGRNVAEKLSEAMIIYDTEIENIVKTNTPLRQASKFNKNREKFFLEMSNGDSVDIVLKKYVSVAGLHVRLWLLLPDRMRALIKRMIKK